MVLHRFLAYFLLPQGPPTTVCVLFTGAYGCAGNSELSDKLYLYYLVLMDHVKDHAKHSWLRGSSIFPKLPFPLHKVSIDPLPLLNTFSPGFRRCYAPALYSIQNVLPVCAVHPTRWFLPPCGYSWPLPIMWPPLATTCTSAPCVSVFNGVICTRARRTWASFLMYAETDCSLRPPSTKRGHDSALLNEYILCVAFVFEG